MEIATGAQQLESYSPSPREQARFCSRCGAQPVGRRRSDRPSLERVCGVCGMGIMLGCPRDAAPSQGAAFLVVTDDLRVTAVSEGAEIFFGPELERLGSTLLSILSSAGLGVEVARAANGARHAALLTARVAAPDGGPQLRARVSSCGPPRAALILLTLPADQ